MQTGDITKQWIPENCGKFNRGVGESQNPVFILSIIIILIINIVDILTYNVIGFISSGMLIYLLYVIVQLSTDTRYNSPINTCNKSFIAW